MMALSSFLRFGSLSLAFALSACGLALDWSPPPDAGDGSYDAASGDGSMGADGGGPRDDAGGPDNCGDGAVDPDEECDDGNDIAGDGCDPRTCTFSCTEDSDCDDGDNCTLDTCDAESHTCAIPVVSVCASPNLCSVFIGCDEYGGCLFDLIDNDGDGWASTDLGECGRDCDDENRDINPGVAEVCDMVDQDCDELIDEGTGMVCGRDADGDGYGSMSVTLISCGSDCPFGYVSDTGDCWDHSGGGYFPTPFDANPAQTRFFDTARGDGTGSYDWNCDGSEELMETWTFSGCVVAGAGCFGGGWDSTVPRCGMSGIYLRCTMLTMGGCSSFAESRTQRCR